MPTHVYGELTQRMPKLLEQRHEALRFESGEFIPTETDLVAGARELAYERFTEYGDADFMSDASTNIPVVDISLDEDRYPIFMLGSGFPVSFQEERAQSSGLQRVNINRYDRRMAAARKVIATRTNRLTAYGAPNAGFTGFLANPYIPVHSYTTGVATTFYTTATYNEIVDFMVGEIESLTDNFVSMEPTTMLVPSDVNKRISTVQNSIGTKSVKQYLEELYPDLEIVKTKEVAGAQMQANGMSIGATKDRMAIYPKDETVLHRHLEQKVAQLAPEEYIRVDGLRRIYLMFSCFTPAIVDYPMDLLFVDINRKA